MKELSTKIVNFFVYEQIIKKEEADVYQYGLEILMENTTITIAFGTLGIALRKGLQTVIYLSVFCGLRRYCGGYHAVTKRGCHMATIFSYLLFLAGIFALKKITRNLWCVMVITYIVCLLTILLLAPVEHMNKPLTKRVRMVNKRKALLWTILLGGVILKLHQNLPEVSFAILVTLIEVALLMIIGRSDKNRKTKN